MKKIYVIALFVLIMGFLPFQKAFALNCVQSPPPEVAVHEYDVVVIATVTDKKSSFGFNRINSVNADVSLSFKGYNNNTITFTEDFVWGESKVGTEYLLFLNKNGNALTSPLCSPTSETAGLDMDKLIENLSAKSTDVIEFDKTDESESTNSSFSWGIVLLSCTFIILVMIIAFIFYQRGKGKRNGKN